MIEQTLSEFGELSREGGWLFWALIVLAFGIGFAMLTIWSSLNWRDAIVLSPNQWRRLFRNRQQEPDLMQILHNELSEAGGTGVDQVEKRLFAKARRRIPFAFVLIGAAPLVGLLGTVSGMTNTFAGISGGGTAPIDSISGGISEALITTQVGLIIAVPSFILCTILKSRLDTQMMTFQQIEVEILKKNSSYA